MTSACFANGSRTPAVCPPPMHNRFQSVHQLNNAHTHPHGIAHKPATPKSRIVAIISTTKRPLHSRLCMAASQLKTNRTKPTLYRYKLRTRTHTAQLTSHWAKSNTPLTNIFPTADVPQKAVGCSLAHPSSPSTYNHQKKEHQIPPSNSTTSICNQI